MVCHTDNDRLYYENKSLFQRFPEIVPFRKTKNMGLEVKFIIRGNISNIILNHLHTGNEKLRNCNGFGRKNKIFQSVATFEPDYKYYYIDHFYSKSTEEFIDKIKRGDAFRNTFEHNMIRIGKYFNQSNINIKKIEMIERGTGLNLSKYKEILNSK